MQHKYTLPCRIPLGYYQDRCWHSHPRFLIQPQVFNFSHPRLLFCPRFSFFATLGYYSTLGFLFFLPQATFLPQVFSFCHPNSPLGFLFFPPQATIPPQVFSFSHPRLLFCPRFSLFPTLGYYPAQGLYLAGKSRQKYFLQSHAEVHIGAINKHLHPPFRGLESEAFFGKIIVETIYAKSCILFKLTLKGEVLEN